MEEKIIVKSEPYFDDAFIERMRKCGIIAFFVGVLAFFIGVIILAVSVEEYSIPAFVLGVLSLIFGVVSTIFFKAFASVEITITNKRVYGQVKFGNRLDLPIDSVSAISTIPLKGLGVSTSSGRISFVLIKNRDEVIKAISDLIVERQIKAPAVVETAKSDSADEIKKYKDLLDSGVITQEEFDAKKKQLLGL